MRRTISRLLVCMQLAAACPALGAAPPPDGVPPSALVDEMEWEASDWTLLVIFGDLGMLAVGAVGALAGGLAALAAGVSAEGQEVGYLAGFSLAAPVGAAAATHRWGNVRGPDGSFAWTVGGAAAGTALWLASWLLAEGSGSGGWFVPSGVLCLVAPALGGTIGFHETRELRRPASPPGGPAVRGPSAVVPIVSLTF